MTPEFDQAAYNMFRAARIERPTMEEVKLLADDLCAIGDESDEWDEIAQSDEEKAAAAVGILRARIGGLTALQGYVNCLKAGAARRKIS